jgi:hypothetical protein
VLLNGTAVGFTKHNIRFTCLCLSIPSTHNQIIQAILDDLIVGAYTANPSDKPAAGKSYVVFGKADNSAIDLSVIADANNPPSTHNQIIQAIAVDIACAGD